MQTNGFNLSTDQPTSTTALYLIGCSKDSEVLFIPAREPRALIGPWLITCRPRKTMVCPTEDWALRNGDLLAAGRPLLHQGLFLILIPAQRWNQAIPFRRSLSIQIV